MQWDYENPKSAIFVAILHEAQSLSGEVCHAQAYLDDVNYYYSAHVNQEGATDVDLVTDWDHMFWAANVLLAEATDEGAFHQATQVRLDYLFNVVSTMRTICTECFCIAK